MLQLVAQLCQYAFGYVGWLLGDKVNTDALGTDEADNLFNLIQKGLRCILKNQMSFVKEENHFGFIQIACFRHHFVELGKHPQQEGGVEQRMLEQFGSMQQVDNAAAVFCHSKPVLDIKCRFTEENIRTLVLQTQ